MKLTNSSEDFSRKGAWGRIPPLVTVLWSIDGLVAYTIGLKRRVSYALFWGWLLVFLSAVMRRVWMGYSKVQAASSG